MNYGNDENCVAEMQGLFGPCVLPERVIHKIWRDGSFRRDTLLTLDSLPLEIVSLGKWNRLAGPDFLDAEFVIGGKSFRGDVEIHFYGEDWYAHGHAENPDYRKVILHVVVFPPRSGQIPLVNASGEPMFTLLLLPHLKHDIESYVTEDALAVIEGREGGLDNVFELLLSIPEDERFRIVRNSAYIRWEQKLNFMRKRLRSAGNFENACHQIVLETLGLRRNREVMSRLSLRFSPSTMLLMDFEELFEAERGNWNLSGIRPANQPKFRLKQYLDLLRIRPNWSKELRLKILKLMQEPRIEAGVGTKNFRKDAKMAQLRKSITDEILGGVFGGTRLDTLFVDAFFPLLSVNDGIDLSNWWFHWFLGDAPGNVSKILRETSLLSPSQPGCNGLFQGLIYLVSKGEK